jgi:hypothetical protein
VNFLKRFRRRPARFKPLSLPENSKGTEMSNFINSIVEDSQNLSYLEIGVFAGKTIEAIKIQKKVAVDPNPLYLRVPSRGIRTAKCTSDLFFSKSQKLHFDLIYLDGLHHFKQTWLDLENAVRLIKPYGIIFIDDVVPSDEFSVLIPPSSALEQRLLNTGVRSHVWHGDVFKLGLLLSRLPTTFMFGTITFSQNPRAFLISKDGDWNSFPKFNSNEISTVDSVDAKSVFGFNPTPTIPESFKPIDPNEAKLILKQHLNNRV